MRKLALVVFILLISINLTSAGEKHYVNFSDAQTKELTINERDIIIFSMPVREYKGFQSLDGKEVAEYDIVEKEEAIMLRNIDTKNQAVDLTVFIEGAKFPQYQFVNKNLVLNVDFERDELNDLKVGLATVKDNEVTLILQVIDNTNKEPNLRFLKRQNMFDKDEDKFASLLLSDKTIFTKSYKNLAISSVVLLLALVIVNTRLARRQFMRIKRSLR